MAQPSENNHDGEIARIEDFVSRLTPEERMLIILKRQLYGGDWSSMFADLENRLAGRPYVIKLQSRIKDDLERVRELSEFEKIHNVDLADFVEPGI